MALFLETGHPVRSKKARYRRANEIRVSFYLTLDQPLGEIGGKQTLAYGWLIFLCI
jgi:hypothetical protein